MQIYRLERDYESMKKIATIISDFFKSIRDKEMLYYGGEIPCETNFVAINMDNGMETKDGFKSKYKTPMANPQICFDDANYILRIHSRLGCVQVFIEPDDSIMVSENDVTVYPGRRQYYAPFTFARMPVETTLRRTTEYNKALAQLMINHMGLPFAEEVFKSQSLVVPEVGLDCFDVKALDPHDVHEASVWLAAWIRFSMVNMGEPSLNDSFEFRIFKEHASYLTINYNVTDYLNDPLNQRWNEKNVDVAPKFNARIHGNWNTKRGNVIANEVLPVYSTIEYITGHKVPGVAEQESPPETSHKDDLKDPYA